MERYARWTVYLYIDFWVLEGALRKWLPGLSEVGYVARDVLTVLALLLLAVIPYAKRRTAPWFGVILLALFTIGSLQVIAGYISLPIMVIGFRSYIALALLPVVIWQYFGSVTLEQISRRILYHLPVQAVLVMVQVLSPPDAPINWTIGEESAGFINFGVVRATGTFSAVSGLGAYLGIAFAVALVGIISNASRFARFATVSAGVSLFCAILGGDRSTLLTIALVAVGFLLFVIAFPLKQEIRVAAKRLFGLVALAVVIFAVIVMQFSTILDSFTQRFASAAESEDSFERLVRQTFEFSGLMESQNTPTLTLIGDGMAAHTQAGIALGSSTEWVEIEATRWVAELGIIGLVLAWARIFVAVILVNKSLSRLRQGDPTVATFSLLLISVLLPGLMTQTPSTQAAFGVMVSLIMCSWASGAAGSSYTLPASRGSRRLRDGYAQRATRL